MKNRIIALLMTAAVILALLPLSVSAASCKHSYGGAKWSEASHPHEYFYYCEKGCGSKQYTGTYMTKSNCAICNPSIGKCQHTGGTWTDSVHPHQKVCTSCCEVLSYETVSGCPDCCTNHRGYYFYESEHQPGGYHNKYLHCNNCGKNIYDGVTYNLSSCDICNPPAVSSVSLSASGESTTLHSSGIIEATSIPSSFSVYADCQNCYVTSLYYYDGGQKISTSGNSISYTASSYEDFKSITFYVETNTGVTDSISVNFNFARYAEASIKWEYAGIVVRSISRDGTTIRSGLSTQLDMSWNSSMTRSDYETIAGLIGAYDGKTYILTGSTIIRVYKPSTGQTLAKFDTYSDFDSLCDYAAWTTPTLNAFESTRVNSLSYQAPIAVSGVAKWVTTDGKILHTETAAEVSGYQYIRPNQSITVAYSASDYTPSGYRFKEMSWNCGSESGTSSSRTSYSKLYNYSTSPVNTTFVYQKLATEGSIKVRAYDADTKELIPSATITCGSRSGSNPATFTKLPLGTYNPSASAPGYLSASGSVTLTDVDADKEIDLFLVKSTGDVTVYVYDSETNRPISGASVSGAASGTTDSNGRCVFKDIPFGTIKFTASASGYYSASGTVAISRTNRFDTVTIYLDPIPTTGNITVRVIDSDNGSAISGAYVSCAGESGTTDSSGCVGFYDIPFGSYTFTASADGYYSGSASGSISLSSMTDTVTISLTPIKTDLSPDAIINGDIYKGSTIIVSAEIHNDGNIDLIPGKEAIVTMTATRNNGSVFDTQTKSVIIPANDSNLVWFEVDMPKSGYTSDSVTFSFDVSALEGVRETTVSNNIDSITKSVIDLPARNCDDAGLELTAPESFSYSRFSSDSAVERTWSVYEWDGGFVRRTYTAKLKMSAVLVPDNSAGYRKKSGNVWTTRSGYGLNTEVNVSVDGSEIAGTLKVDAFYPEYNYSTLTNKSDRLELVSGKYVWSEMHHTPLWFPDKAYSVKYYAYDLWCPGGMLYGYANAYVNIAGDMYDDLYTN